MTASDAEIARLVGRFATMRALAARAVVEQRDDARALFGAAMAFRISGDYRSALDAFERACAAAPDNTHFHYERGVTQEYLGAFGAAERAYAAALAAEPQNYKAKLGLVQLKKQTSADNSIAELEALFGLGDDAEGWRSLHLGHALAKAFEDLDDLPASFKWLDRAKARRRALRSFDRANEDSLAAAAMRLSELPRGEGCDAEEAIFVTGLPRSGTTLVDRILSSHPDVTSAGEIGNFLQLFKLMTGAPTDPVLGADRLGRAGEVDFARLGRSYIDSTRPLTGAAPRFVDKAPSNYFIAPLILRALPNARIVCMRRHPLDSVLSNYKQIFPFDDRYHDYVYDLEATAHKFTSFDRVLRHWQATLSADRFMLLQYEDLVSAQEETTRKLLSFCGLAWDERCLAFHRNETGVATPSAAQVRTPMYAAAIGRWARYGALLDPARHVLERAGLAL